MECEWHSGVEADLVCMKCGKHYCRECVKETREAHYCPDCHRESVERFAAQMGGRKEPKPAKVKEPKVKEPKPPKDDKKLRKPAERRRGPTLDDLAAPPPPPVERPEPSLTPEERAAFWSDDTQREILSPFTPVEQAAAPPVEPRPAPPVETRPAQPPAPGSAEPAVPGAVKPAGPIRVEGMPPPLTGAEKAPVTPLREATPLGPLAAGAPGKVKRRIPTREEREAAVLASEGFPTGESKDTTDKEALNPPGRIERLRRKRREGRAANLPVAMQIPDDYDGEITSKPSYLKAVLFGLGAGLVTAGAFAALAWWTHKDLGLFGWVIGFAVGVAVVFGSGRHFSWRLGLIAAAIALVFVSVQRIGYFMLDLRFNDIIPLKLGIWPLFRECVNTYWESMWSLWLVFLVVSGLVAFLVAWRPPPIRLNMSEERTATRRVAGGKA